jgi:hypothetical protein
MYQKIWLAIKALPDSKELAVRTHRTAEKRVIQAVKLEKTKEVAVKKQVGMLTQGPLVIRVGADSVKSDSDFVVIYFSLKWDYSKL